MAAVALVGNPYIRCETQLALKTVGKAPKAIMMHGATIAAGRIYIMGGRLLGWGWSKAVWSAPINSDSTIGDWRTEAELLDRRCYISNTVVAARGCLYILGGSNLSAPNAAENTSEPASDILWSKLGEDGRLGEWQRSEPFDGACVSNAAAFASERALYLTGGSGKDGIHTEVSMMELADDGSPKSWRQLSPLPDSIWYHGAALLDNTVFVWGGLRTKKMDETNDKLFTGTLQPDGSITDWQKQGVLMTPLYSSGFVGMNGFLVSVAGRYSNGYPTNGIWYTQVKAGKPGEWTFLNTDLQARLYVALAVDREHGRIFAIGGRDRKGRTPEEIPDAPIRDTIQAFQLTASK